MSSSQLSIIVVRHAEPAPFERAEGVVHRDGPRSAWDDRPLSARGLRDAGYIAASLAPERPIAIYSSPYRRARQTVEPLAAILGISIIAIDDLRERLLSPELVDDHRAHMRRAWNEFDYAPEGGESSRQAQSRAMRGSVSV